MKNFFVGVFKALGYLITVVPFPQSWIGVRDSGVDVSDGIGLIIMIVAAVISTPIVEEITFRLQFGRDVELCDSGNICGAMELGYYRCSGCGCCVRFLPVLTCAGRA